MTTALYHLALPQAVFANPAASILLPIALGTAVGYSTRPNPDDLDVRALRQPPLRPPPYVFGPVWTALYGLMGYAAYRAIGVSGVAQVPRDTRIISASLYTVQLGLNLAWMPLFFSLRRPIEATVDSVVLLGLNVYLATLWLEHPATEIAGWCMVPYVAWLSFATYLSAGTGYLNGWSLRRDKGKGKARAKDQ